MEPNKTDIAGDADKPNSPVNASSLLEECQVMLDFAYKTGKSIDPSQVGVLNSPNGQSSDNDLLPAYNYLIGIVKPAVPGTLLLFHQNQNSKSYFRFLGPLPIVRRFMLVTLISLFLLISVSLSPLVDVQNIQLSMLQGSGLEQILRLIFLIAAASVGASFYALFEMNSYISEGTFDSKYASTYWSRFVLGIVAGLLLSELFVVFIDEPTTSEGGDNVLQSASYLLKPILAILGGFSASLVYRIMNKLIEMVESLFAGSVKEVLSNKKQEIELAHQTNESRLRSVTAQNLLALKQQLVSANVGPQALDQIDDALSKLISVPKSTPASIQSAEQNGAS